MKPSKGTIIRAATIAAITPVVLMATQGPGAGDTHHRTEYMPCGQFADEAGDPDGPRNCVHDALHEGNGLGQSFFVGKGGKVTYLPHHIAHYLLNGGR
jgi:hypothetical protein